MTKPKADRALTIRQMAESLLRHKCICGALSGTTCTACKWNALVLATLQAVAAHENERCAQIAHVTGEQLQREKTWESRDVYSVVAEVYDTIEVAIRFAAGREA